MTDVYTRAARRLRRIASPRRRRMLAEVAAQLGGMIVVGTHHKTGTVWLSDLFQTIAREYRLRFFAGEQRDLPSDCQIFFDAHSRLDPRTLGTPYRGLHLIRDPRDVIVSGCFYHQRSGEDWLHVKRADLGGLSLAEKLNSLPSLDDRILFEMEQISARTIREMLAWDYATPDFLEIRYEDLIEDVDLALFHRIFSFLGFPGRCVPELLEIAYHASLFSGDRHPSAHVRSGRAAQWPEHFTARHRERFLELFGDALVRLGYEENDDWVTGS